MSFLPAPKRSLARARTIVAESAGALEREAIRMEEDGEPDQARAIRAVVNAMNNAAMVRLKERPPVD